MSDRTDLAAPSAPFHPGTPWELFRFESPEVGGGAVAVADPAPAGDPAAVGEPAGWGGPSQEQWEGLQQQHAALLQWAQQRAQAEAQAGRQPLAFDPFGDDPLEQINALIDQRLGPVLQAHEQMELAGGEQLAQDIIADNVAREGEFLHTGSADLAFQLSRSFLPEAIQRYGYTDRAGEAALEQACKHVRALEETIGKAYHDRQMNQLGTLAGGRGEPGASPGAAQVPSGAFAPGTRVTDRYFGGR